MKENEPCPNARRRRVLNGGKLIRMEHWCNINCAICKGAVYVEDCPDCSGAGLRVGGVKCNTCNTCGKIPLRAKAGAYAG